jgi:pre-mRNA-splicing helicase BRR2
MAGRGGGRRDWSIYNYSAISSLVLSADKSLTTRRDKEPDGAPESLAGRIDPREMGSRVLRAAPKDVEKKKKKAQETKDKPAASRENAGFGYTDIIEATHDVEGLIYRPRTAETREVYEVILTTIHGFLGDQAQDVIRSAADTVLETLKNENVKDFDKKKDVEEIVGPVSNDIFSQLITLSKKITDYSAGDEDAVDPDMEKKDAEIDDELGVAVVFDEDEQEEEEEEGFEIREESDEEAGGDEEEEKAGGQADDQELVIGQEQVDLGPSKSQDRTRLNAHEIDGFFIQRRIAEFYPDAETAATKAADAMGILGSEASLRDAENSLMDLFDWSHHELVTLFIKNRDLIVWCTKLVRSDADERVNVEVAMRERGLGWILRELSGQRTKRGGNDAMDVDESPVKQVPSTMTLPSGSVVQPQRIIDLESMAFAQGGHLMSNKKCKLPEGSFKRSKKGYEEIHVPRPKQRPAAEENELIPVSSLPDWARAAFGPKTTHLNRVQSKVYPVAFGTDEPILLCAPTGAGKVSSLFFHLKFR